MDTKKSVAICVTTFLYIMLFAVIGSCFMAFKYEDEKVVIVDPKIYASDGISVLNLNNKQIDKLEFSDSKLGLKPVTGELDTQTKVPITVTDKNGSEGLFVKFIVKNSEKCQIKVKNLSITGNEKLDIVKERKNIWFSVKEIQDSTKNFEDNTISLGEILGGQEGKEYTLLFWLSSVASEDFEKTEISFDIYFE